MRDDRGNPECRAMPALDFEYDTVDHMANHARQEDDEGVDHALDQRQRHHVAVRDVAYLMANDGLGLVLRHVLQQSRAHRDQ